MDVPGRHIRQVRDRRGLSLSEVARRAHVTKGYLSMVERGERVNVSESLLRSIGDALGVDLVAQAAKSSYAETARETALVPKRLPDGTVIVVEMDRRAFLATATAGAAGALAAGPIPDRITPEALAMLSDRHDWYIAAGRVSSADAVSRLMRSDVEELTRAVRWTPAALRPDLMAVATRYATYLGWLRQEAGDVPDAMHWLDRAADFARVGQWRNMVPYTMARKADLMQVEHPHYAAELAHAARANSRFPASIRSYVAAHEAEAHARAGNERAARTALDAAWDAVHQADPAEGLPVPQLLTVDGHVRCRQARVELRTGRPDAAIATLEAVRPEWTTPRSIARYAPPLAHAYVQVGDIDAACRTALSVADNGARCDSATARRELGALRTTLRPWAGRTDVDQVLTALSA